MYEKSGQNAVNIYEGMWKEWRLWFGRKWLMSDFYIEDGTTFNKGLSVGIVDDVRLELLQVVKGLVLCRPCPISHRVFLS